MVIVTHGAYRVPGTVFQEPSIKTRMVIRLNEILVSPSITWKEVILWGQLEGDLT